MSLWKEEPKSFVNLSSVELNHNIREIFSLGMKCHLKSKYNSLQKKIEVEKLYKQITSAKDNGYINVDNQDMLLSELRTYGLRVPTDNLRDVLSRDQYSMIKDFNSNEDIVVRKADKTNTLFILNKPDYISKLMALVSDTNKFKNFNHDSTEI